MSDLSGKNDLVAVVDLANAGPHLPPFLIFILSFFI